MFNQLMNETFVRTGGFYQQKLIETQSWRAKQFIYSVVMNWCLIGNSILSTIPLINIYGT